MTSTPSLTRFWSMEEWSDLQIGGKGHSRSTTDVLSFSPKTAPGCAGCSAIQNQLLCARPDDRRGQLSSRVARIRAAAFTGPNVETLDLQPARAHRFRMGGRGRSPSQSQSPRTADTPADRWNEAVAGHPLKRGGVECAPTRVIRGQSRTGEASHGTYWHRCPQEGNADLHPDGGGGAD
jgi:hypothetical protein